MHSARATDMTPLSATLCGLLPFASINVTGFQSCLKTVPVSLVLISSSSFTCLKLKSRHRVVVSGAVVSQLKQHDQPNEAACALKR